MKYAVENEIYKAAVKLSFWISLMFAPFSFVDQLTKLGSSYLTGECELNNF